MMFVLAGPEEQADFLEGVDPNMSSQEMTEAVRGLRKRLLGNLRL
jgi:hypothetical protein